MLRNFFFASLLTLLCRSLWCGNRGHLGAVEDRQRHKVSKMSKIRHECTVSAPQ